MGTAHAVSPVVGRRTGCPSPPWAGYTERAPGGMGTAHRRATRTRASSDNSPGPPTAASQPAATSPSRCTARPHDLAVKDVPGTARACSRFFMRGQPGDLRRRFLPGLITGGLRCYLCRPEIAIVAGAL